MDDVYLGNGASELIQMAMNALVNDGDEILIPAPDFPLYTAVVGLSGGRPVHYLCDEGAGWLPDLGDIESKITPARAASSSATPTTRPAPSTRRTCCWASSRIARKHGLVIFADGSTTRPYDGNVHVSGQPG